MMYVLRSDRGKSRPVVDLLTRLVDRVRSGVAHPHHRHRLGRPQRPGSTAHSNNDSASYSASPPSSSRSTRDLDVAAETARCRSGSSRSCRSTASSTSSSADWLDRARFLRNDTGHRHAVPAYDVENLDRLAHTLEDLDAVLYTYPERTNLRADGAPPELDGFVLSGPHLRTRRVWQFMTDRGTARCPADHRRPGWIRRAHPQCRTPTRRRIRGHDRVARRPHRSEGNRGGRDKDLRALGELRRLRERKGGT